MPSSSKLGLKFSSEVPVTGKAAQYAELYEELLGNPGQGADVTDAIENLAKAAGAKVPKPGSSVNVLQGKGFRAKIVKVDGGERVWAGYFPPDTEE